MKKYILICISCCFAWIVSAQSLKVMSFNIHSAQDASIEQIAAFIKLQDPDVVMLQEIDYYTTRSGRGNDNKTDMLTALAYHTGMQGMFYPIIDVHGGKYGNAILSKLGMESTENILLPHVTATEQRAVSVCKLTLPEGLKLTLVCTHLDMANLTNGMNQIKKLNELFDETDPVIVGGDMNRRVGTAEITELSTVWELALSNEFDHIGFLPKGKWTASDKKIFSEPVISDHKPIMVTLNYNQ